MQKEKRIGSIQLSRNVPQLRFSEFEGDWEKKKLKNVAEIITGSTPSTTVTEFYNGDKLFVSPADIQLNRYVETTKTTLTHLGFSKGRKVKKGSVLFVSIGSTIGKVGQVKEDVITNQQINSLISKSDFSDDFIYSLLEKNGKRIKHLSGVQAVPLINKTDFSELKFNFPSFPEQQKIANFLTAVDTRLQTLANKKSLLELYKKGVMQKIFKQELRFKDEDGKDFPKWEKRKLSYYLKVSNKKNTDLKYSKKEVLSVSGEFGIVNQIEFQGRSFAGASVHNYGVVEKGDIVYTKSPLKANPYGIIKVNKGNPGIVSTLYAVYSVIDKVADGNFIEFYFQLDDNTNRYLRPLVRKGAKNDMKINNHHVLIDSVLFPSKKEQTKITDFLSAIDKKIALVGKQIERTKTYKKGLLQQMFV